MKKATATEKNRDPDADPAYDTLQIANIAWTSSTARHNPAAGILAIRFLRDLLARWSVEDELTGDREDEASPIVHHDSTFSDLLSIFESLAVASSESMQHQSFAAIGHVFAVMFNRIPPRYQDQVESIVLRILSASGDEVPTEDLDGSLDAMVDALRGGSRAYR